MSYEALILLSKRIGLLTSISHLLEWDQETMMPREGLSIRSQALSLMAHHIHREKVGKKFKESLCHLIDLKSGKILKKGLSVDQRANVREWRRDFKQGQAIPSAFVSSFAELTAKASSLWAQARKEDNFSLFAPALEKIVSMSRKKADYLGYSSHPYDALLDCFEPDMTIAILDPLFKSLGSLKTLLKKTVNSQKVDDRFLEKSFPASKQLLFCREMLEKIGFDFSKGRLDLSAHPFSTSLAPNDCRITTRVVKAPLQSLFSVLHEAGHSFYDRGLPEEHFGTPLGEPISYAIHESQSRLWETRLGQSLPFWRFFFPRIKKRFSALENVSLMSFYRAVNKVQPGFIRVEADEVTYSLHILLRYELEKSLIEGTLRVYEIPEAWNAKMKTLLGITPSTYREGALQDIHWSLGSFGYFPSYTLGNLYAAHFFKAFEKENPTWQEKIAKGDFQVIHQWLHDNIHRFGRRYSSKELLKRISHESLSAEPYLQYLEDKYGKMKKLS